MFETATLPGGPGGKRVWTTCVGITGEALLVASAMLAPMVWPQILPKTQLTTWLTTPGPPVPPAHPGESTVRPREQVRRTVQFHDSQLYVYTRMPAHPVMIDEPPEAGPGTGSVAGAIPGDGRSGVQGSILNDVIRQAAVVPAPPPVVDRTEPAPLEKTPVRIRLGGVVLLGRLIHRVEPVYPRAAIQMRVAGQVELEAVVGTDGRVRELVVKSGNPLLIGAAVAAVRQWMFQPTLLDGNPVEVSAPVLVTFRLGQ